MSQIAVKRKVPSTGPSITEKEIELVTEAVTYGWYKNMNKYIDQFAEEFSSYLGIKYCLPTCHGTSALHLACAGLNLGVGDEVIVPDITWVASAAAITYVGATPVFADVAADTWCLDPQALLKLITPKTKAIMLVDLIGNMPLMDEILEITQKHDLKIIEDAAEGIGALYKGKLAGTFGDVAAFSFSATKLIMSGQGGMLVTDNKEIYEKCRRITHHGIDKTPGARYYWSNEMGYNYNWSNIQAALALAQLRRIDEFIAKKHMIFNWYKERLKDVEGINLNSVPDYIKPTYWLMVATVDSKYGKDKDWLCPEFKKYGIDMRPFFYPISSMPTYHKYCVGKNMAKQNPVTYEISPYGICLPYGHNLEEDDVDYVCEVFRKILNK